MRKAVYVQYIIINFIEIFDPTTDVTANNILSLVISHRITHHVRIIISLCYLITIPTEQFHLCHHAVAEAANVIELPIEQPIELPIELPNSSSRSE